MVTREDFWTGLRHVVIREDFWIVNSVVTGKKQGMKQTGRQTGRDPDK